MGDGADIQLSDDSFGQSFEEFQVDRITVGLNYYWLDFLHREEAQSG